LLIDELIEKAEKSENTLLYRLALLNELNQLVEEKNKKVKTKFPIATPSNLSAIISDSTLFRNYLNQVLDFLKRTVIDESMRQYRDLI
ncbi:DNA-binding response regulator, partial [Enterococcus sp. S181_ASV_20]|nr:DNA-binding response regulator [Enterococcus sp. S181_ASV_20]